jgi:hypothetical protein
VLRGVGGGPAVLAAGHPDPGRLQKSGASPARPGFQRSLSPVSGSSAPRETAAESLRIDPDFTISRFRSCRRFLDENLCRARHHGISGRSARIAPARCWRCHLPRGLRGCSPVRRSDEQGGRLLVSRRSRLDALDPHADLPAGRRPQKVACAENRAEYYYNKEADVPTADKPDF